MIKISRDGEFGFIKSISGIFSKHLPAGITGIGDDCAVIRRDDGTALLVTTDLLAEGCHFIIDRISACELGRKSLLVSISDIAAMGGKAESAFLSMAIPVKIKVKWLDDFMQGVHQVCKKYDVHLLGGDTTKSTDGLVINFTVLGSCRSDKIKLRSQAKPGQIICVTGFLGDSGAGLKLMLENKKTNKQNAFLIKRHHNPEIHAAEGVWLAGHSLVGAMMDVSDGPDSDIRRIMEASGVGAEINTDQLPLSGMLKEVCATYKWNAETIALTGGEDYCLLLTIDEKGYKNIADQYKKRFSKPLFAIGKIRAASAGLTYFKNGKKIKIQGRGFDHFK